MQMKVEIKGPLFDNPEAAIQSGMDSFVSEVVTLLEQAVRDTTPVGVYGQQGGLLAGIHGEPYQLGTPNVYGIVGHQSVYGDVVEMGRRPGSKMPPKGSLVRWIEVKFGMDTKEAERIEFLVRRKIGQKGFDGAAMFQKAFENNQGKISDVADRTGMKIAFDLGGKS